MGVGWYRSILGVVYYRRPERANVLIWIGVFSIAWIVVVQAIAYIMAANMTGLSCFNLLGFLISLILQVIYLVGAFDLKAAQRHIELVVAREAAKTPEGLRARRCGSDPAS